ncbi:hypothetical protein E6H36_05565 [Candidatus Bathyarchaeota archaeon]|nr:MAG: hypothetical protein E6H36_05565 [Candidatus Bathyarchaeota archaeon]
MRRVDVSLSTLKWFLGNAFTDLSAREVQGSEDTGRKRKWRPLQKEKNRTVAGSLKQKKTRKSVAMSLQ